MAVNQILASDSQGMANVGKSLLLENIKIDVSVKSWYDIRWLATISPEVRGVVKALEVDTTYKDIVEDIVEDNMKFFCRVLPGILDQKPHDHDESVTPPDDCIVNYLLYFLNQAKVVKLRLYCYDDYFENLQTLPELQEVEIDFLKTTEARYCLQEMFGLFRAAPALREVRIVHTLAGLWDAELMPHLPYLEKIDFVNCELDEKEITSLIAGCPKLRIFRYSVK
ncbi:hypothetical protein LZ31DRAFT_636355 [Colletotrichum somersetense]|nr:hypothetical protein LZ31DRAFT_636355 [Colletotrichum somersetense]